MVDIRGLAYFVAQIDDVDEWKRYAEDVLGMMTSPAPGGGLYVKMDERPFRILVVPGAERRYVASGWELAGEGAFKAALATLEAKGVGYELADPVAVAQRGMQAIAVEAAEQCGILTVPAIDDVRPLDELLAAWPHEETGRRILFCDEAEEGADPVAILNALPVSSLAVLVGPEGGFADDERALLRRLPFVTAIPLGPRILRADTAAVAALTLVQAVRGDWRR